MNLKKILSSKNKILGAAKTISAIHNRKVAEVLVASNYPANLKKKIEDLAEIDGVKVTDLKETNEAIGAMCKKPFAVSVIGLLKTD